MLRGTRTAEHWHPLLEQGHDLSAPLGSPDWHGSHGALAASRRRSPAAPTTSSPTTVVSGSVRPTFWPVRRLVRSTLVPQHTQSDAIPIFCFLTLCAWRKLTAGC